MSAVLAWAGCSLFDVVHPAFPLPTTASPTLQDAVKDFFFVEAVVAYDTLERCEFPSPDSCQKRFLWTQKEVDLAPHPVVSPVLQAGDAEEFPQALRLESLDPVQSQHPGSIFYNHRGGWR